MGTSFFWFYDVVLIAVLVGVTFRSAKKGAVAVIIGTVSVVVAFFLAFFGSDLLSARLYDRYIAEPLIRPISDSLDEAIGDNLFSELGKIDLSKAVVDGKFLGSIEPSFDRTGKMTLDLSDVDLTETGMEDADLTIFGIGEDFDYSLVKLGTIEIAERELNDHTLEELILARILTANAMTGTVFTSLEEVGELISHTLPLSFGDLGDEISNGANGAIYPLILGITALSRESFGESILREMIDPIVKVPLRVLLFLILFTLITLILNVIASASKIINRIPVVASVNELLGGLLGLVKAILILFVICIGVQFLIALTENSLVFLNTYTIDRTFAFRHIYHFDFIDFLETYL
ncbi:MAG: hypothetical protein NC084_05775 [Bacteroides sp.]|nr:hypothetical protein [Eubacterium sp.]MCM1418063.1 hypothetical protein [Roseburia sp.]MCM1462207.1 hypothetical protein [Bacteroides sp.]